MKVIENVAAHKRKMNVALRRSFFWEGLLHRVLKTDKTIKWTKATAKYVRQTRAVSSPECWFFRAEKRCAGKKNNKVAGINPR